MPTFVFETDAIPETWQFLNGLRRDDLIAELIQNELDAGSTSTQIIFERDRLICEGNGEPIDKVGWTRLSFFRGAGDRVPRKRAKTGVKNHGLKACFTIADDIIIRSAGKYTKQTLHHPERAPKPYPGAMESSEDDPVTHKAGCRVEVPYRTEDLHVNVGEPLTFSALDEQEIDGLYEAACSEIPQRFFGVVRPGLRSSYEIEVSHWKHGTKRFSFLQRPDQSPRLLSSHELAKSARMVPKRQNRSMSKPITFLSHPTSQAIMKSRSSTKSEAVFWQRSHGVLIYTVGPSASRDNSAIRSLMSVMARQLRVVFVRRTRLRSYQTLSDMGLANKRSSSTRKSFDVAMRRS